MISAKLDTTELFETFNNSTTVLMQLISSFGNAEINRLPFADSWTAAQIGEHLSLSNSTITQILNEGSMPVTRHGDERIGELQAIFLDFSLKFKTAPNIAPAERVYDKEKLINSLQQSLKQFKEAARKATLGEAVFVPRIGEITKFELLYLVLFHTQRHLVQLQHIKETFVAEQAC